METIIVEIRIAAIDREADFMLPAHVPVGKLIGNLISLIEQSFPEIIFGEDPPLLCSMIGQRIIPYEWTLAQAGVRDSHKLLVV